jgi:hypothetical protein
VADNVTLRFQGRFMHVQKAGVTSVVAPRFPHVEAHHPFMSIRHSGVLFAQGKQRRTTLEPSYRILSDDASIDAQVVVWDLTGLQVQIDSKPSRAAGVAGRNCEVASLQDLEKNEGRKAALNVNALKPGDGLANAVIDLFGAAEADASPQVPTYFFSKEDVAVTAPKKVLKKGTKQDLTIRPADRVEYVAQLMDSTLTLSFFDASNARVGLVRVKSGAVVCFSNWCPKISDTPDVDLEFSRYYDLLETHNPGALVPFMDIGQSSSGAAPRLAEGIPCYQQAKIKTA